MIATVAFLGFLASLCLVVHYTFAGLAALREESRKEYANIVLQVMSIRWKSFAEIRYSVNQLEGVKLSDKKIKIGLDHLHKIGLIQEKSEYLLVRDLEIPFVWYRRRQNEEA